MKTTTSDRERLGVRCDCECIVTRGCNEATASDGGDDHYDDSEGVSARYVGPEVGWSWRGTSLDLALVEMERAFGAAARLRPILLAEAEGEPAAGVGESCYVARAVRPAGAVAEVAVVPDQVCATAASGWIHVAHTALCLRGDKLCVPAVRERRLQAAPFRTTSLLKANYGDSAVDYDGDDDEDDDGDGVGGGGGNQPTRTSPRAAPAATHAAVPASRQPDLKLSIPLPEPAMLGIKSAAVSCLPSLQTLCLCYLINIL
ncbi:hypothetical protein ACJJTC_007412 [Scirpophaga incertulas]